jgi:hypothetical protein
MLRVLVPNASIMVPIMTSITHSCMIRVHMDPYLNTRVYFVYSNIRVWLVRIYLGSSTHSFVSRSDSFENVPLIVASYILPIIASSV